MTRTPPESDAALTVGRRAAARIPLIVVLLMVLAGVRAILAMTS